MTEIDWLAAPYVEALPRFRIVTLMREWRLEARLLFWYDENHALIGGASMAVAGNRLELNWHTFEHGAFVENAERSDEFVIVERDDGDRSVRWAIVCPRCHRRKDSMLLSDRCWQCRRCHGVKNLSNSLDQQTRLYIRLDKLSKTISKGKPKHGHHASFARDVAEYERLKAKWGDRPPRFLRPDQQWRTNEHYFKPGEAPHPTAPEPSGSGSTRRRR